MEVAVHTRKKVGLFGKLLWVGVVFLGASAAAWEKLFSPELRIGFLVHARDLSGKLKEGLLPSDSASSAPQLIFNDYINAGLTAFFLVVTWILVIDSLRVSCAAIACQKRRSSE